MLSSRLKLPITSKNLRWLISIQWRAIEDLLRMQKSLVDFCLLNLSRIQRKLFCQTRSEITQQGEQTRTISDWHWLGRFPLMASWRDFWGRTKLETIKATPALVNSFSDTLMVSVPTTIESTRSVWMMHLNPSLSWHLDSFNHPNRFREGKRKWQTRSKSRKSGETNQVLTIKHEVERKEKTCLALICSMW